MNPTILFPQQREGHSLAPQLGMYIRPVRLGHAATLLSGGIREQAVLKVCI